jgi:hypothetical protein
MLRTGLPTGDMVSVDLVSTGEHWCECWMLKCSDAKRGWTIVEIDHAHLEQIAASESPTDVPYTCATHAHKFGSWWFLGGQAFFLFVWLVCNTLLFTRHFDPPPYIYVI